MLQILLIGHFHCNKLMHYKLSVDAIQVTQFLRTAGLKTRTWPVNSPDLNPIENCWQVVGKKLARKNLETKENSRKPLFVSGIMN